MYFIIITIFKFDNNTDIIKDIIIKKLKNNNFIIFKEEKRKEI